MTPLTELEILQMLAWAILAIPVGAAVFTSVCIYIYILRNIHKAWKKDE